jgi:hypothetical protein
MKFLPLLVILGCIVGACQKKDQAEKPTTKIQLDFVRVDRLLAEAKSVQSVDSLLKKHPEITLGYFQCPPEKIPFLAKDLFGLFQNPALRKFYLQSQGAEFYGGDRLEKQLTAAFQRIYEEYPQTKTPKIRTVFSGFGGLSPEFSAQNMVISDTLIIVGLDFFMGKKGMFLPPNVYDYQLRKLEPKALIPQLILQYSAFFNQQNPEDHTLLSDMIWYGKSYAFTKKILPNVADTLLFGYTTQELVESNAFQGEVWEHFIDQSLLFKKDEATKTKYVGERPKTPEIGPACPGGIGRWLGWVIVDQYWQQNPGIRLQKLMSNQEANRLFLASGYRGKPLKK